jgi:hypothetical protein
MPNAIDLTTMANVKTWLGLASNNTDDALLDRLITAASSLIQEVLDRDIVTTVYSETYHGIGSNALTLRQYPVQSVASVVFNGMTYTTGFTFDERTVYLTSLVFPAGKANVRVNYTAGFTTVPFGLQQACVELVGLTYREKDRIGHVSKQLGGELVSFNVADLPARVKTTLHQWMNVVPA